MSEEFQNPIEKWWKECKIDTPNKKTWPLTLLG